MRLFPRPSASPLAAHGPAKPDDQHNLVVATRDTDDAPNINLNSHRYHNKMANWLIVTTSVTTMTVEVDVGRIVCIASCNDKVVLVVGLGWPASCQG
jgi:predicted metal-binding protein